MMRDYCDCHSFRFRGHRYFSIVINQIWRKSNELIDNVAELIDSKAVGQGSKLGNRL